MQRTTLLDGLLATDININCFRLSTKRQKMESLWMQWSNLAALLPVLAWWYASSPYVSVAFASAGMASFVFHRHCGGCCLRRDLGWVTSRTRWLLHADQVAAVTAMIVSIHASKRVVHKMPEAWVSLVFLLLGELFAPVSPLCRPRWNCWLHGTWHVCVFWTGAVMAWK